MIEKHPIIDIYGFEVGVALLPFVTEGWSIEEDYLISPTRHSLEDLESDFSKALPILDVFSRQARAVQLGVQAESELREEVASKWEHEKRHIVADEGLEKHGASIGLPIQGNAVRYYTVGPRTEEQLVMICIAPDMKDQSPTDQVIAGAYLERIKNEQGIPAMLEKFSELKQRVNERLTAAKIGPDSV